MPYRRKHGGERETLITKSSSGNTGEGVGDEDQKGLGTYREVVDFAKDPLIHMFYAHLRAGLQAFSTEGQNPEQALMKYKYMLRLAESYLGAKYGFDFVEFRRQLVEEYDDEAERLLAEVQKVAELMEQSTRTVEIVLRLRRRENLEFLEEQKELEKEPEDEGDSDGKNAEESEGKGEENGDAESDAPEGSKTL